MATAEKKYQQLHKRPILLQTSIKEPSGVVFDLFEWNENEAFQRPVTKSRAYAVVFRSPGVLSVNGEHLNGLEGDIFIVPRAIGQKEGHVLDGWLISAGAGIILLATQLFHLLS